MKPTVLHKPPQAALLLLPRDSSPCLPAASPLPLAPSTPDGGGCGLNPGQGEQLTSPLPFPPDPRSVCHSPFQNNGSGSCRPRSSACSSTLAPSHIQTQFPLNPQLQQPILCTTARLVHTPVCGSSRPPAALCPFLSGPLNPLLREPAWGCHPHPAHTGASSTPLPQHWTTNPRYP